MVNIALALQKCFQYKNFSSGVVGGDKSPNFPFLLDNLVNIDFKNPYALYLEVTSLCNLRCKHCFFGYDENNYHANDDMSKEEILSLIDLMVKEHEICAVNIMGKEPFMRKDIFEIIQYIKQHGLYLRIQTNGTLINEESFKKLGSLLDKKNDVLHISIDGAIEEIHDDIRGKGNFVKTKNIIKMFTDNGYNVILAYTLNAINVATTPLLYELCQEIGVKSVLLGLYEDFISPNESLIPKESDVILACAQLLEKSSYDRTKIFYDLAFLSPHYILNFEEGEKLLDKYMENQSLKSVTLKCHKSERVAVMSNGDVYLCPSCQTTDKKYCLGNIREKVFSDIWASRCKNIFFCSRKFQKSLCKNCKYLSLCKGGCMVSSQFTYGTLDAPTAGCKYHEKLEAMSGK